MAGLAGYNYRKLIKKIKKFGFSYYRQAKGSHEIWYNEKTNRFTTIPNHPGDIPIGTMHAILNQAGQQEKDHKAGETITYLTSTKKRGQVLRFFFLKQPGLQQPAI